MARRFTLPDGYCIESASAPDVYHDDFLRAMAIAEGCFHSAQDAFQMTIDEDTVQWIVETIPEYWNLIKFEGTVVGSTLIMPTSRPVMTGFLDGTLTEAGLFEALQRSRTRSTECVYCAGAALLEPHRGQGLALASLKISIDSFIERENPRPTFYYWLYSDRGRPLALALRRYLAAKGLPLLERAQTGRAAMRENPTERV